MPKLPPKKPLRAPRRPNKGRGITDPSEAADWLDEAVAHFYAVVYREEWFAVMDARGCVLDAMDRLAHLAQPQTVGEHLQRLR